MASSRPIWRGHLRLALVSCPVALYSAKRDKGTIHFNLINPETGNRIRMITQDAETGQQVSRSDLVKGYEFKKNTYLLLTDDDFASVKVESSSTITIDKFVEADSIDPIYYDGSYYLAPDGKGGDDVYAVLREAISKTGRVALSRVVIAQRERTIAIRPMDGIGMVAHVLNEQRDINNPSELFEPATQAKLDPEMVELAVQLVDRQSGRYDPADIEDHYEARLRAMIDAKLAGEGIRQDDEAEEPASNVIDLMAALKKSLDTEPSAKAAQEPNLAKPIPAKGPKRRSSPQASAKTSRKRA